MKTIGVLLIVSLVLSSGLTFLLFAPEPPPVDPIRDQYADTFAIFGKNAEEIYQLYDTDGLALLQEHQIEGLSLLERYNSGFQQLQPYMKFETVFLLFQDYGDQLDDLLALFQPAAIATTYDEFGKAGLGYVIDEPEVYFLLQQHGDRLVQLAEARGPLVFTLVSTYQPEFLELYYDDALFTAISHFGIEGLLALKTYRGMASEVFHLFAEDNRFTAVLRQYGYQQTIPVLYYFYHTQGPIAEFNEHITAFSISRLFQEDAEPGQEVAPPDQITREHAGFDRANWALQRLYEDGNSFLRQFVVSENGNVTSLPIASLTNFLENVFIGKLRGLPPPPQNSPSARSASCEQLATVLDVLGLLPYESLLSRQARCFYLQAGLAEARSVEDVAGLMLLDQHKDLVERYGDAAIPFIVQYQEKGIQLLQETDGEILELVNLYGAGLVRYISRYGVTVLELIRKYGDQALEAIVQTDGAVIPYIQKYGTEIFPVLSQPEGQQLLLLCPVFGDEILQYATRYPGEFFQALIFHGSTAVRAFRDYDGQALTLARKYGNEMFSYLGTYGDKALRFMKMGQPGVVLMQVLPEEFWQQPPEQLFRYGSTGLYLRFLALHPGKFHDYIGRLGTTLLPVKPAYTQLAFWTLAIFVLLTVLTLFYRLFARLFGQ